MGRFAMWMAQIRANFLILSVLLVLIGWAFAYKYLPDGASFQWINAVLIMIGVISAHISVNLFNEYSDYKTKIDFNTRRTPFSGGSGILVSGKVKPKQVKAVAMATLILSVTIGIYFTIVAHWSILVISAIGVMSIVFYTDYLAKLTLGELFSGLTLGSFVVLGTYISMFASSAGNLGTIPLEVILASIPPGILTSLLLLLNEFPDVEADKQGGRNHLVIRYGKRTAAVIYSIGLAATFGIILVLGLSNISSAWLLLALAPLPLAVKAGTTAIKHGGDPLKLIPALGSNVLTVLATDLLIAVAILIEIM